MKLPGSNSIMDSILKTPNNCLITNPASNQKSGDEGGSHSCIFQNLSVEGNSSNDCENPLLSENNEDNFSEFNDTFHVDLGNVTDTSTVFLEYRDDVEMNQNSPIGY